jgi:hypothetical protein
MDAMVEKYTRDGNTHQLAGEKLGKTTFFLHPGTFGPLDSDSKKGGRKGMFYVFMLQNLCLWTRPY